MKRLAIWLHPPARIGPHHPSIFPNSTTNECVRGDSSSNEEKIIKTRNNKKNILSLFYFGFCFILLFFWMLVGEEECKTKRTWLQKTTNITAPKIPNDIWNRIQNLLNVVVIVVGCWMCILKQTVRKQKTNHWQSFDERENEAKKHNKKLIILVHLQVKLFKIQHWNQWSNNIWIFCKQKINSHWFS